MFKNLILLLVTAFTLCSLTGTNNKHIGEWVGTSEGETGSLILDETNHAVFIIGGQKFGGKEFNVQGKKMECRYVIDYTKKPVWLDIVVTELGKTTEFGRMEGIVRFITDNQMEYRISFEEKRFEKFDMTDKESTMIFDRVIKK